MDLSLRREIFIKEGGTYAPVRQRFSSVGFNYIAVSSIVYEMSSCSVLDSPISSAALVEQQCTSSCTCIIILVILLTLIFLLCGLKNTKLFKYLKFWVLANGISLSKQKASLPLALDRMVVGLAYYICFSFRRVSGQITASIFLGQLLLETIGVKKDLLLGYHETIR